MSDRASPRIVERKRPRQARSTGLVADVLEAARQVLARAGMDRFTTARVAERAGVSVGSLYQYFPNKAAILFRLQSDEWRDTAARLDALLSDASRAPAERLDAAVHAFVRSECEEAAMRRALGAAAPSYRTEPEAETPYLTGSALFERFVGRTWPDLDEAARARAGRLIATTLGRVGEHISERDLPAAEMTAEADALAQMLRAYLESLRP